MYQANDAGAPPGGLVGLVEVEQQAEGRHADDEEAEDDGERTAVAQPGVDANEQAHHRLNSRSTTTPTMAPSEPLREPRGDRTAPVSVDDQHADEHARGADDGLQRDARVDAVEQPRDPAEGHAHRGRVEQYERRLGQVRLEDQHQRDDEAQDERG